MRELPHGSNLVFFFLFSVDFLRASGNVNTTCRSLHTCLPCGLGSYINELMTNAGAADDRSSKSA